MFKLFQEFYRKLMYLDTFFSPKTHYYISLIFQLVCHFARNATFEGETLCVCVCIVYLSFSHSILAFLTCLCLMTLSCPPPHWTSVLIVMVHICFLLSCFYVLPIIPPTVVCCVCRSYSFDLIFRFPRFLSFWLFKPISQ